jgi:hypothetical protein
MKVDNSRKVERFSFSVHFYMTSASYTLPQDEYTKLKVVLFGNKISEKVSHNPI